jgi:hypothetical protein
VRDAVVDAVHPLYATDCDADVGASGGIGLIRRDGKWMAKAIAIRTAPSNLDHTDYDPDKGNATLYLGIDRDFLRAVSAESP